MSRNLKALFKTDPKLERKGVELDYEFAVITVARAGGSNSAYRKALVDKLKPYRQALETGLISEDTLTEKFVRTFADHAILDWRTRRSDGSLVQGIADGDTDGELLPFTADNVFKFLMEVPELYEDLQKQASGRKLFLQDLDAAAGN